MGTLTLLRHLAPLHDAELDEHGEHKLELGQPQTVARQLRPHLRMRPKQARRLQPLLHMVTASTTYGAQLGPHLRMRPKQARRGPGCAAAQSRIDRSPYADTQAVRIREVCSRGCEPYVVEAVTVCNRG